MSTHHISSLSTLFTVAGTLLVLTFLTVAVTWFNIPEPFNIIVAITIAVVKASCVALFFMNLYWDTKFNLVILLVSLLFLGIMAGITLLDTLFRDAGFPVY